MKTKSINLKVKGLGPDVNEYDWITVDEASKFLGVSRVRIHQLAKRDKDEKGNPYIRMANHPTKPINVVYAPDVVKYKERQSSNKKVFYKDGNEESE